ncbi:hypothetical protein [Paraburkholderia humisilvae]|nr:hypothetical protein [Paraburkholderia humisilvae]
MITSFLINSYNYCVPQQCFQASSGVIHFRKPAVNDALGDQPDSNEPWTFTRDSEQLPPNVPGNVRVNSLGMLRRLTLSGLGLALLPARIRAFVDFFSTRPRGR